MTASEWMLLLNELSRWSVLGERELENGTRLLGHVPHVAPDAWLHLVFSPLSDSEIAVLEDQIGHSLPLAVADFYRHSNGLLLFSGSLSIDGLRGVNSRSGDAAWQPFSIHTANCLERPSGAPVDWVYFGSYAEDGSQVVVDAGSERVYHCDRGSIDPKLEWHSIHDFLRGELRRLSTYYDETGRLTIPNPQRLPELLRSAPPPA